MTIYTRDNGQWDPREAVGVNLSPTVQALLAADDAAGVRQALGTLGVPTDYLTDNSGDYMVNDVVRYRGALARANTDHTSASPVDSPSRWDVIAAASAIPEDFGAVGDGTTNCRAAFESARSASHPLAVLPGKVYRISANTTAGVILNFGGLIQVDSGVTFTFDDVVGADNQVLFSGAGIAKSSARRYSVGWYGDADLADAWDFCRRGFETNYYQTCVFPQKRDATGWTHSRPLQFDDPENRTVYTMNCAITASATMSAQIIVSPTNKTEDIIFWGKIDLEGAGYADYGVKILGGARIRFMDILSCGGHLQDSVLIDCTVGPSVDQFYANIIYGVRYGGYVLNAIGRSGPIHMMQIGNVFGNGVRTGGGLGVANFEGNVIGSKIDMVSENGPSGTGVDLMPSDKPIVRIAAGDYQWASAYRAPYDLEIGKVFAEVHPKLLLKTEQGGSMTAVKSRFTVGGLERFRTVSGADQLADIDWCTGSSVRFGNTQQDLTMAATIGSNVSRLSVHDVDPYLIKVPGGVYSKLRFDGRYGADCDVADDAVIVIDPNTGSGVLRVHGGVSVNGWAQIAWRADGQVESIARGTSVKLADTALTGTTGTDGRLTIGVSSAGLIYIENRLGSSRRVTVWNG